MPWRAFIRSDLPVVETSYFGKLTPAELSLAARETIRLGISAHTTLFLGDCTALEGGHSVFDLYAVADFLSSPAVTDAIKASGMTGALKEAVLLPAAAASKQDARFWETTALNRGLQVQVFEDRQAALDWLVA